MHHSMRHTLPHPISGAKNESSNLLAPSSRMFFFLRRSTSLWVTLHVLRAAETLTMDDTKHMFLSILEEDGRPAGRKTRGEADLRSSSF